MNNNENNNLSQNYDIKATDYSIINQSYNTNMENITNISINENKNNPFKNNIADYNTILNEEKFNVDKNKLNNNTIKSLKEHFSYMDNTYKNISNNNLNILDNKLIINKNEINNFKFENKDSLFNIKFDKVDENNNSVLLCLNVKTNINNKEFYNEDTAYFSETKKNETSSVNMEFDSNNNNIVYVKKTLKFKAYNLKNSKVVNYLLSNNNDKISNIIELNLKFLYSDFMYNILDRVSKDNNSLEYDNIVNYNNNNNIFFYIECMLIFLEIEDFKQINCIIDSINNEINTSLSCLNSNSMFNINNCIFKNFLILYDFFSKHLNTLHNNEYLISSPCKEHNDINQNDKIIILQIDNKLKNLYSNYLLIMLDSNEYNKDYFNITIKEHTTYILSLLNTNIDHTLRLVEHLLNVVINSKTINITKINLIITFLNVIKDIDISDKIKENKIKYEIFNILKDILIKFNINVNKNFDTTNLSNKETNLINKINSDLNYYILHFNNKNNIIRDNNNNTTIDNNLIYINLLSKLNVIENKINSISKLNSDPANLVITKNKTLSFGNNNNSIKKAIASENINFKEYSSNKKYANECLEINKSSFKLIKQKKLHSIGLNLCVVNNNNFNIISKLNYSNSIKTNYKFNYLFLKIESCNLFEYNILNSFNENNNKFLNSLSNILKKNNKRLFYNNLLAAANNNRNYYKINKSSYNSHLNLKCNHIYKTFKIKKYKIDKFFNKSKSFSFIPLNIKLFNNIKQSIIVKTNNLNNSSFLHEKKQLAYNNNITEFRDIKSINNININTLFNNDKFSKNNENTYSFNILKLASNLSYVKHNEYNSNKRLNSLFSNSKIINNFKLNKTTLTHKLILNYFETIKFLDRCIISIPKEECIYKSDNKKTTATKLELLFDSTIHGDSASTFHKLCDGHNPTLIIIKPIVKHQKNKISGNLNIKQNDVVKSDIIIGGFTFLDWKGTQYKKDILKTSLLFSIKLNDNSKKQSNKYNKYYCYKPENAIYCFNKYGPTFGGGFDLRVYDNFKSTNKNSSYLGHSYRDNSNNLNCNKLQSLVEYSSNFEIEEMEVFKVIY